MRKEALIHIIGTQIDLDNKEDRMEFITEGSYHQKNNAYYIIYRESQLTGMEGVTTSLKVESNKITLNRMGQADYRQEYIRGSLENSTYVTSMGTFLLGAYTEEMDINLTENGGHITLKYSLFSDGQLVSKNTLRIRIKEDTPR